MPFNIISYDQLFCGILKQKIFLYSFQKSELPYNDNAN